MKDNLLGNKVRELREKNGWSQEYLAKLMGYKDRGSICKIENGRPVSQKIIVKLADVLNTRPSYLMGWEDNMTEEDEKYLNMVKSLSSKVTESSAQSEYTKALIDYINENDVTKEELEEMLDYLKFKVNSRK